MEKPKTLNLHKSFYWQDAIKTTVWVLADDAELENNYSALTQRRDDGNIEIFFRQSADTLVLIHESLHAISFLCESIGEEQLTLKDAFTHEITTYEMSNYMHRIMRAFFDLTEKIPMKEVCNG